MLRIDLTWSLKGWQGTFSRLVEKLRRLGCASWHTLIIPGLGARRWVQYHLQSHNKLEASLVYTWACLKKQNKQQTQKKKPYSFLCLLSVGWIVSVSQIQLSWEHGLNFSISREIYVWRNEGRVQQNVASGVRSCSTLVVVIIISTEILFFNVYECFACVSVQCNACISCRCQKEVSDHLELELLVNCLVGPRNGTWALYKRRVYFQSLSHLSSSNLLNFW